MPETKLPKEVLKVIDKSSKVVGRFAEERFNQDKFNECLELGTESPIEQILYCALNTIREINYIKDAEPEEYGGKTVIRGLGILPQSEIGKYRIDFMVYFGAYKKPVKEVLVECDSQQFHERTEQERRYEKARDRFLRMKGYTVFHYTGKEIIENPYKIASEIIAFVTEDKAEELYETFKDYQN